MRIAIFTELYAPSVGGQELFFEGIAKSLRERGHAVEVFTIGHEAGLPEHDVLDGIPVTRAPIVPTYKQPRWAWAKRNWGAIFRYALATRRIAARGEHDLYILNQWPLLHAVTLPRRARARAVLHWCEIRHGRFYRALQAVLPRLTRYNAAISDSVGAAITAASGRPVLTLPSGVTVADYLSPPRALRRDILSLGRITAHKNLDMLVDSFELLKAEGYGGRLLIAGDGPAMGALKARVARSTRAGDIVLLGLVDEVTKQKLLAESEVLAMTSTREGFPRVVAEAMSSGLPVVTSAYPENGTKDVVARFGAGVVTATGAAAFAAGIRASLGDWEAYSQAGLASARSLDWSGIARDLEAHVADA